MLVAYGSAALLSHAADMPILLSCSSKPAAEVIFWFIVYHFVACTCTVPQSLLSAEGVTQGQRSRGFSVHSAIQNEPYNNI